MAIGLHNLEAPEGANKRKKRVGRGPGSGHGKTSTRGHKGQKSRSGYSSKRGFEGGQMPLHRRLPKRGFTNPFKKEWTEVNLSALEKLFQSGETVTPEALVARGVVKKIAKDGVAVLGNGTLTKSLQVTAHRFSKSAQEKITAAGGTAQVMGEAAAA
jgi:large subunit ribosomal protein L15